MAESSILRFLISGQDNAFFLVEILSNGSKPLDLKLIGSESTAVFLVKLRHKRVGEYKSSSSGHCTDEEWEQILISTFLHRRPVPDVEIKADVQSDGSSTTLSFRKNIQGITQRLGSIKLEADETTEISPFDWCVSAIGAQAQAREDLAASVAKVAALEDSVKQLKSQLEELIVAKEEDENQLLEKFRDLLNEKKVKIRQQQRLLASASVDPEKLANVGASQNTQNRAAARASRAPKRKAKEEPQSGSEDDGFEKMDVDGATGAVDDDTGSDSEDAARAQMTDGDTTPSEVDSDDGAPLPPAKSRKSPAPPVRKNGAAPTAKTKTKTKAKAPEPEPRRSGGESDSEELPPPRVLPFMRNKQKAAAPAPKPVVNGDETGEDDDDAL
ncbi:hypothetical protein F4778DRAFT_290025 [Xylariomycetidae sp. FL2044]|nr:hypothetical protein F4778DRAFT_290025 [Xylariomycetidae sp. FL2044]